MRALPRLLLVTDRRAARRPVEDAVRAALGALPRGAAAVMLREKDLDARALLALARALRAITFERDALLLVNGRFDVALAAQADGVHLGGDAPGAADVRGVVGSSLILGVSVHGDERPDAAADYAVLAPVFATASKPGVAPLGLERLRAAVRAAGRPVFALGGVDFTNARSCLEAGAAGVAVRGAVLGADDPAREAARLWAAIEG